MPKDRSTQLINPDEMSRLVGAIRRNADQIALVLLGTRSDLSGTNGDESLANNIRAEAYQEIAAACRYTLC